MGLQPGAPGDQHAPLLLLPAPLGLWAASPFLPLQSPALLLNSHFLRFSSLCNTNLVPFTFLKEPDFQLPLTELFHQWVFLWWLKLFQSGLVPPFLSHFSYWLCSGALCSAVFRITLWCKITPPSISLSTHMKIYGPLISFAASSWTSEVATNL